MLISIPNRNIEAGALKTGLPICRHEKRLLVFVLGTLLFCSPVSANNAGANSFDDVPVRPRNHWAVQFDTGSEKAYLEQIDALQIELGLVHLREAKMQYASKVSQKPVIRTDIRRNEKRFYLAAGTKKEKEWEADVFAKKGMDTAHSLTLRYFPKQLVKKMMVMEDAACKELGLMPGVDVVRTQFGLKKSKTGWEIVLVSVDRLK